MTLSGALLSGISEADKEPFGTSPVVPIAASHGPVSVLAGSGLLLEDVGEPGGGETKQPSEPSTAVAWMAGL